MNRTTHTAQMATTAAGSRPCTGLGHSDRWCSTVTYAVKPIFANQNTGSKRPTRPLEQRTT